jgi:hypothetical protein
MNPGAWYIESHLSYKQDESAGNDVTINYVLCDYAHKISLALD